MNNKRRHLIMIFISITICSVVLLTLFLPRPIVKNADSSVIMRISYNPYIGQDVDEWIELDGYDKHAVLDCLSRFNEYRTLSHAKSYWMGDVELEIWISWAGGVKIVILGNINYSYSSYGEPTYTILKADELRAELLEVLNISSMLE